MSKYETMLVTSAKLDEESIAALIGKFKSLIEANGTIEAVDDWGKRRLAYPINKEEEGVYTLIYFESDPDFPAELERVYRITDGVLRSLIIAREDDAELPAKFQAKAAEAEKPEEVKAEAPAEESKEEEAPAAEESKAEESAEPAEKEAPAEETATAATEEQEASE